MTDRPAGAAPDESWTGPVAATSGLIFALLTVAHLLHGNIEAFAVCCGVGLLFAATFLLHGAARLGMLTLAWLAQLAAFAWSIQDESFGAMDGGFVFLLIFVYLGGGVLFILAALFRTLFRR